MLPRTRTSCKDLKVKAVLGRGTGVAQWQFSDDAEQELWDVLGSNPELKQSVVQWSLDESNLWGYSST